MVLSINAFSIFNNMNYIKKSESITVDDKRLMTSSNPVTLIWNRTWTDYYGAEGISMGLDSLNNSYITGYGGSMVNSMDVCLVKYNSSGHIQWDRTWGNSNQDVGQAILINSTNDIYIAGYTQNGFLGDMDVFLLKYNSTGGLQWDDVWGGSGEDYCYGMAIDKNNNIFLAGYTESWITTGTAMFLLKYNTSGGLEWNRTWGGGFYDGAMGIVVDSSDDIYLGGTKGSDICLVKFDNSGVWQWNRSWNTVGRKWCAGITIDSSDDIYLVGEGLYSGGTEYQFCLLKYNKFGVLQWSNTWEIPVAGISFLDLINGISLDSSNNIYLPKKTIDDDLEIEKFDSSGNKKWDYVFGGTGTDSCNGIVMDTINDIYIVGTLDYELYVAKFSENPPGDAGLDIPGYNQWMLICVLSIVSSVIAFSISLKIKLLKKNNK